jgi:hypothetical protein
VTDARRALLGELIDHAPLFPPASLPLEEALEDHRRARESPYAWMVRRFVAPASRMDDLDGQALRLSMVADEPFTPDERVEAVESRDPEYAQLVDEVYLEGVGLDEVEAVGAGAKVRCGGVTVPSPEELGGFVRSCRERGIRFKATAGLHHAVRTKSEHGFLNLLAAVVFGHEEDALAESDEDAFLLDEDAFAWRHRSAGADELAAARGRFSGIGSCSFTEPVEELERLGML